MYPLDFISIKECFFFCINLFEHTLGIEIRFDSHFHQWFTVSYFHCLVIILKTDYRPIKSKDNNTQSCNINTSALHKYSCFFLLRYFQMKLLPQIVLLNSSINKKLISFCMISQIRKFFRCTFSPWNGEMKWVRIEEINFDWFSFEKHNNPTNIETRPLRAALWNSLNCLNTLCERIAEAIHEFVSFNVMRS